MWLGLLVVAVVQTPTPGASLPGTGKKGVVGRTVAHSLVVVAAVAARLEFRSSVTEWELKNAKMVLDSLKNELIKLFICHYGVPIIGLPDFKGCTLINSINSANTRFFSNLVLYYFMDRL